MSESQQKNQTDKSSSRSSSRPRTPTNPFEGSALFSSGAPALPDLSEAQVPPPATPTPAQQQHQSALLYNSPAPPEYILRPFELRHDRQTVYFDARKAGALDALVKLVAKGNKTELLDEMLDDLFAKYAAQLQANEELVKIAEAKYRKKHNL